MSVALLIEEIDGNSVSDYTPIATQAYFVNTWLPICEQEGMQWIPLFETGASFNQDDLPLIIEEVQQFKRACDNQFPDKNEQILVRLELLIDALERLKGKKSKFFIG